MPAMRSIVRNMLEEMGFSRISEAESGDIAWDLIRGASANPVEAFGLVIADWNMPGISGVDLLRAVRSFAHTRTLPFVMVTAEGDHKHLAEASRAGVTEYVVKPFNGAQLGDKISDVFSG